MSAEKGSNGDEEGERHGPDHDDTILGGSIHYPLRFGLPYLGYRQSMKNQTLLGIQNGNESIFDLGLLGERNPRS